MVYTSFLGFICLLAVELGWLNPVSSIPAIGRVASKKMVTDQLSATNQDSSLFLNVLFATNDDCDLYISDKLKGRVSKQAFFYLKLEPGTYYYRAKSRSTGDELKESFTVSVDGINEVFVDLLYTIDEKAEQRRLAKTKAGSSLQVQTKNQTSVAIAAKQTALSNKERVNAAVQSLLSGMIPVNKGSFVMGNNKAPAADEVEHPVTVSALYFAKYEVTQEQWEAIMEYNPSLNRQCSSCPVENITWEEAIRFTHKLSAVSDRKFRLPTEAEWEYVARMGGRAEIENAGGQEAYIKKTAWYASNSKGRTSPVGKKDPNVLGIYDLMGNVSEWCQDWYDGYFYQEDYSQKDPEGPPLGKDKVVRGGNYKEFVGDRFRPSFRNKKKPTEKGGEIGLRIVMEAD